MAGSFPDVPGFRFEYDRDGSVMLGSGTTLTVSQMRVLNSETPFSDVNCGTGTIGIAIAWPEPRTVTGIFTVGNYGLWESDNATVYSSPDTTNGADGTWTSVGQQYENIQDGTGAANIPTWCRQLLTANGPAGIVPWNLPNIRGLQFAPVYRGGWRVNCMHIYGQIPLTSNPDRLVLCDASGAVTTNGAYFDFGNAARSTTDTKSFRIKNNSAVSTANSIAVGMEALYDSSPTFSSNHDLNFGGSWVKSGNIGNLAPGATSATIQFRRNTPAGAAVGPWQGRITAVPASMT